MNDGRFAWQRGPAFCVVGLRARHAAPWGSRVESGCGAYGDAKRVSWVQTVGRSHFVRPTVPRIPPAEPSRFYIIVQCEWIRAQCVPGCEGDGMRVVRKLVAGVNAAAAAFCAVLLAAFLWPSRIPGATEIVAYQPARIAAASMACFVAVAALIMFIRALARGVEPASIRLGANGDIEVRLAAIESCARTAASEDPDVLIDRVDARVCGKARDEVRFTIDADLKSRAEEVQRAVERACDRMLGIEATAVRVRFLPSKTVTLSKEVNQ